MQRCNACQVECAMTELSCWLCGGVLEVIPLRNESGEFNHKWLDSAARYNTGRP